MLDRICTSSNNIYVFGVYWNPDLSHNIFYCLLTAMAKVQSVDRKTSLLFVGEMNVHQGVTWVFYDYCAR